MCLWTNVGECENKAWEEVRREAFREFMKRLIEMSNLSFPCQCQAALCSSLVTFQPHQLLWDQSLQFCAKLKTILKRKEKVFVNQIDIICNLK